MVKMRKKNISIPLAVCIGVFACMAVLVGAVCLLTGMVLNETLSENSAETVLLFATCMAAFIGSIIGSATKSENKATVSFIIGGMFYSLLLIIHFMLFPGPINRMILKFIAVLIGTCIAYFVGNSKKSRGYKRIKKYRLG